MRRLLATTMALGLVVTAMGFTGIFAVFTDRATTGRNTVDSGEQPRTAHLQIGIANRSDCTDATFSDDLETGLFSATGVVPGTDAEEQARICLKNVGTASLDLVASAIDVVETETDCTGDEEAAGDATCGTPNIGDGELGNVILTELGRYDCVDGWSIGDPVRAVIQDLAVTPGSLGALAAGETACFTVWMLFPVAGVWATSDELQQAQSDRLEWRYAFDGTAS